jgi:hypothetical protein
MKEKQLILVQALQNYAIELGRTPSRSEFVAHTGTSRNKIITLFGDWVTLVHAAGLKPQLNGETKKFVSNEHFKKDVKEVIAEYNAQYPPIPKASPSDFIPTLIIGDTHFPFTSQYCLDKIYEFAQKNKPGRIIQMGDLYDMYAHTKFPKSQNSYNAQTEEKLGREGAEEMWKILRNECPKAELVQLLGNHDIRATKRTVEQQNSVEHIVEKHVKTMMSFEGVNSILDYRQEYYAQGVMFLHGYRSQLGAQRDYTLMNTVAAHTHKGGVLYRNLNDRMIWELNPGFVGDAHSKALSYTSQKWHDQTLGFGYIDSYGPRFIFV